MGRYDEAEGILLKALQLLQKLDTEQPEHEATSKYLDQARVNLSDLYFKTNRPEEARKMKGQIHRVPDEM